MVFRPAAFKVTQGNTKIGKVVRGTHDLQRRVGCCAHKIVQYRYINLAESAISLDYLIPLNLGGKIWSRLSSPDLFVFILLLHMMYQLKFYVPP